MTVTPVRSPLRPERTRQLLLAAQSEPALARAVRLAATALRAPVALLTVPDGIRLHLASQVGVPEPWAAAGALPLHSSPCRHVLGHAAPLAIGSLAHDPLTREDPPLEGLPRGGYLGVSVRVSGQPVAVLSVRHAVAHVWSEDEITLLRDVGEVLSGELAVLAAGPGALERVRGEQDWRSRENRWRVLLEQSGSGVFTAARDGQLTEVNAAVRQILGVSAEGAGSLLLPELCVRPNDWPLFQRELELQGFVSNRELLLRRWDGGEAHCVISATVRRSERGEVIGYEGVLRDVTEQRQAEQRLLESALHDPLTRLPNRTLLLDRLERLLRHSKRRTGYRFALLFIDLDRFKEVNDTHGHQAGDRLLLGVAERLAECVRQEDTVARIGGDEFAVLLDAIGDATGVIQAAERILSELGQPYEDVAPTGIGASIGIALSMTGYDNVDSILRDADTAMYRAKAAGANRYAVFDAEMDRRMRAQLELETQLKHALTRDQLKLQYHPVIAIEGGKVMGMEALLRWTHPDRGVLLPDDFIPLAERSGLIVDIGWWVIREACRQLRAWQDDYPETGAKLTMSVNLSARQFLQPDLVRKLDAILLETGVDPTHLRLDVTEASVTQNTLLASRLLSQLEERGVKICIDDFGTGYSSLNELRRLPISGIKIAPRFVRELQTPENGSRAVVQTIIALGRSLAIEAIAEGVETPEQLEQLRTLGTRFAQGFLFSLPLDSEHARALLAS